MNDPSPAQQLSADDLRLLVEAQTAFADVNFDLDAFMQEVVDRMQFLTNATGATIELLEAGDMVYRATSGSVAAYQGFRIKAATSLSGRCVAEAKIMLSPDTEEDDRVDKEACRKVGARSMIVVPLFSHGKAEGVLKVVSTSRDAFDGKDIQKLTLLSGLLGATLGQQLEVKQHVETEDKLRQQAQYDALTGLPNRTLFHERLSQAIARSASGASQMALFYLDIDHFKPVNDTHGHDKGDALLRLFATRIGALLSRDDTFSRLGGDEFAVILEHLRRATDVEKIAAAVVAAAKEEFDLGGLKVRVGASVGVVTVPPGTSTVAEELIKRVDAALYEVKRAGRGGFRVDQA
jgi:diguanylate cyclase (GGDEF)-like protein